MADKNLRLRVVLDLVDKAMAPLKRINQGSQVTAGSLKAARDQLQRLGDVQKTIGTFRESRAGLADTSAKLQTAQDRVRQLAAGFGVAGPPTKAMAREMAQAKNEAAQLGTRFAVQQQQVQQLRDKLSAAGISTRNLASGSQQLRANIAATTDSIHRQTEALKAQGAMQRRAANLKAAQGSNIGARSEARGALLDGVALAATLGAPIKMAMDWEQRLAELNKVADKTPPELNAIASAAQELAVKTGVAREEIIGAYIAASQAGFAESEWAQFAEVSAKMGVAFDTTGERAGEMLKAWRSGMSLSMDQAAQLAGTVNHIANSMNATALDIGGVLQRQGAYLSAMGLTDTQSSALAATMLSGGATEEIAATASKNFMKALTVGFAASKSQLKVFDMLKLDPERLAKQMQRAPEKAIVDVMKRLQKLAPDQLAPAMKMLFGDESIGPAAQIVKSVDGLVAAFEMAGDTAKTMNSLQAEFDSMGNTTQQQMKKAGEGIKVATTALGAGLLPAINSSLAAFAPMALGLGQWMQANERVVTNVVAVVAAVMAFKIAAIAGAYAFTFLKGAWLSGQAVLLTLRSAWMLHTGALVAGSTASRAAVAISKALTAAQWLFNAAIGANPIGLLILGIVALVAASYLLWSNWDAVLRAIRSAWESFSAWAAGLWGSFSAAMSAAWSAIAAAAGSIWQSIVANVQAVLGGGVGAWLQVLINFSPFGLLWGAITSALGMLGIQVPEGFRTLGGFIVDGIIGGITAKIGQLRDAVVGVAGSVAGWFKEKLGIASPSKVFTQFGGWISEGAANGIEGSKALVRDAALAMAGAALVPVSSADGAAQGMGSAPTTPVVSSGTAMAPRTQAAAPAAAGGNRYTITINPAPGADPQAIARAVAAELDRRERAAGARRGSSLFDLD